MNIITLAAIPKMTEILTLEQFVFGYFFILLFAGMIFTKMLQAYHKGNDDTGPLTDYEKKDPHMWI